MRIARGALLWPLSALFLTRGAGAEGVLPEYRVKATYLYNFSKCVVWPPAAFPEADAPFVIGVLGQDPFGSLLDEVVANRSIGGRRIVVRRFRRPGDVRACQILFISRSERERLAQILSRLGRTGTLTVGETEQFLRRGGMIQFLLESSRVRLAINPDAAARAGLKISSPLLSLRGVVIEHY
jgi:hypothetical protein